MVAFKKIIYILEDNDDIRELLTYLLETEAYGVIGLATISDFNQALSVSYPDAIILDVMLPDGNGIDACINLKSNKLTKFIPVLLMSANANVINMKQQSGADDFINKPFDIHEFVTKINKMLP